MSSVLEPVAGELLTVREVAATLKLSACTVYRWIESGALPVIRVGRGPRGRVRIHTADLAAFVDGLSR